MAEVAKSKNPRSVFVVHGRDDSLRTSMFEFLRSINLAPLEWSQAVELTRQGSPYIGEVLDAAFAHAQAVVVLFTPDEIAYLQTRHANGDNDPETQPAHQSRPNVLFEAGMAMGRDPDRTVMVEVGQVRPFSDVAGRHLIRLTNTTASRQQLAHRLQNAGCEVDLTGTDWHHVGDFSPPLHPGGGLPLGRRIPKGPRIRPTIDFDLRYVSKGGNRIDKLQIINRGTDPAYEVTLSLPENAALSLHDPSPIEKIPGGSKSVTVDVWNSADHLGAGPVKRAFDVTVEAKTEDGEIVSQDVFIDLNG